MTRPIAVDLFAGAGGLSLGLQDAGFDVRAAVENDASAVATYRHNFSHPVLDRKIEDVSLDELREAAGIDVGEATLVAGGPPCQGFSVQRRGPSDDERNELASLFVRYAIALQPAVVLMENVPAIRGPRGALERTRALSLLAEAGFEYTWLTIQASDYGVPQSRRRAFLIAWNPRRAREFTAPAVTHPVPHTVRSAIADLPEPPLDHSVHPAYANHVRVRMSPQNVSRIMHVPYGGGRLDLPLELQLPCHRRNSGHRHLDVYGRLVWDEPAPTITAMFDNFTRGRFAHPTEHRNITAREGARLQSFPDSFEFLGTKKSVARQIGNAVPPLMARAVGRAVLASVGRYSTATAVASRKLAAAPVPRADLSATPMLASS